MFSAAVLTLCVVLFDFFPLNYHIYQFYYWVVLIHTNTSCLACSFGISVVFFFFWVGLSSLRSRTRIPMLPQYHY